MRPRDLLLITMIGLAAFAIAGCGGGSSTGGGQPRDRGGEESVEGFGSEAHGSERTALVAAFRGYLAALAARNYSNACSGLSSAVQSSLERLASARFKGKACGAVLPAVLAPSATTISRRQARGRIARARIGGDRAFVVFHAPGASLYQLAMVREDGTWKATTVLASVLVPSAATLAGQ